MRYTQIEIRPQTTGTLIASIVSSAAPVVDTVMALYCQPMNPNSPGSNLMAVDDDGGGYPFASLTARNIQLTGGQSYYLVISHYSNAAATGSFRLELGDNFEHIYTLRDVITTLKVMSGHATDKSTLTTLSDIPVYSRVSLDKAILILQKLANY